MVLVYLLGSLFLSIRWSKKWAPSNLCLWY